MSTQLFSPASVSVSVSVSMSTCARPLHSLLPSRSSLNQLYYVSYCLERVFSVIGDSDTDFLSEMRLGESVVERMGSIELRSGLV